MRNRYEPILCIDESWMVFDLETSQPAEERDRVLIGLSAAECGDIVQHLNRETRAEDSRQVGAGSWTN